MAGLLGVSEQVRRFSQATRRLWSLEARRIANGGALLSCLVLDLISVIVLFVIFAYDYDWSARRSTPCFPCRANFVLEMQSFAWGGLLQV